MMFERFVDYVFSRDVLTEPWYWSERTAILVDRNELKSIYVRLFKESAVWTKSYSLAQLEQGFWAIQSQNFDLSVFNYIWSDSIKIEDRVEVIREMYSLFENFFAYEALDTSLDMWWDSFAYRFTVDKLDGERKQEYLQLQNAMFGVLQKTLALDSVPCQFAALHGINHLHHPEGHKIIEKYLLDHPELTDEDVAYAKACIVGEAP